MTANLGTAGIFMDTLQKAVSMKECTRECTLAWPLNPKFWQTTLTRANLPLLISVMQAF